MKQDVVVLFFCNHSTVYLFLIAASNECDLEGGMRLTGVHALRSTRKCTSLIPKGRGGGIEGMVDAS